MPYYLMILHGRSRKQVPAFSVAFVPVDNSEILDCFQMLASVSDVEEQPAAEELVGRSLMLLQFDCMVRDLGNSRRLQDGHRIQSRRLPQANRLWRTFYQEIIQSIPRFYLQTLCQNTNLSILQPFSSMRTSFVQFSNGIIDRRCLNQFTFLLKLQYFMVPRWTFTS